MPSLVGSEMCIRDSYSRGAVWSDIYDLPPSLDDLSAVSQSTKKSPPRRTKFKILPFVITPLDIYETPFNCTPAHPPRVEEGLCCLLLVFACCEMFRVRPSVSLRRYLVAPPSSAGGARVLSAVNGGGERSSRAAATVSCSAGTVLPFPHGPLLLPPVARAGLVTVAQQRGKRASCLHVPGVWAPRILFLKNMLRTRSPCSTQRSFDFGRKKASADSDKHIPPFLCMRRRQSTTYRYPVV